MDDNTQAAAPAEKTINVATAFTVIVDGRPVRVEAGVQKVPAAIADHWYTQNHLVKGGYGTPEYAKACRDSADAAFVIADAAVKKYEGLETAAQEAERAAGLDEVEPAYRRLRPSMADVVRAALDTAGFQPSDELEQAETAEAGSEAGPVSVPAADAAAAPAVDPGPTPAAGEGEDSTASAADPSATPPADAPADAVVAEPAPAPADAYPNLSPAQEKALDRDGDGKPGGAPKGGNRRGGL